MAGNFKENNGTCTITWRVLIIPHKNCNELDIIKFIAKFPINNVYAPELTESEMLDILSKLAKNMKKVNKVTRWT